MGTPNAPRVQRGPKSWTPTVWFSACVKNMFSIIIINKIALKSSRDLSLRLAWQRTKTKGVKA